MKLYMHPVSTTSRPVLLLIAENNLDVETQLIDLLSGEQAQDEYAAINPNRLVPVLEDGDFRLTESATILRYLAAKYELASYPDELQQRARIDERIDWFNTQFYRAFGYGLHYPQLFPQHRRESEEIQNALLKRARQEAEQWLSVLDEHLIGPEQAYLCGNEITIADYFGISLITLGELSRCNFSAYPNISRWINNMKQLPGWNRVNDNFYQLADNLKQQHFEAIGR